MSSFNPFNRFNIKGVEVEIKQKEKNKKRKDTREIQFLIFSFLNSKDSLKISLVNKEWRKNWTLLQKFRNIEK